MNTKGPFGVTGSTSSDESDRILDMYRLLEQASREITDIERMRMKNDSLYKEIININSNENFIKKDFIEEPSFRNDAGSFLDDDSTRRATLATPEIPSLFSDKEIQPLINSFLQEQRRKVRDILSTDDIIQQSILDFRKPSFDLSSFPRITEGDNVVARDYMMGNFGRSMFIFFEVLKNSPELGTKIREYLTGTDSEGVRNAEKFRIDLQRARTQRDLNPYEEMYIESIEELSKFNPFLVALLREARVESYEFMCHHFDSTSDRVWENISDKSYVPQLQIGTGPDGLSFFAEQTRKNPSISENTLVVDIGSQPGGPFAIPEGDAWRLNSSNNIDDTIYNLPDPSSEVDYRRSVRGYSSPYKWYPGERTEKNPDVRRGSINIASDYSPTPDMISDNRYATNFDAQLVFAAQAALLMKDICMKTEFISSKPSGRKQGEGSEEVILRRYLADGTVEEKTIFTDKIINATGLGEVGFGFNLEGSRAQELIDNEDTTLNGFPRVSGFLDALRILSSERTNIEPPETITIGGLGDSGAILIEELAGLFKTKNPLIRNIKKIYIITDGELSNRPRYAAIRDVLPRGGRGNIVEIVSGRVGDIGYSATSEGKMNVYSNLGAPIKTNAGKTLETDAYISATGLRKSIDEKYEGYFTSGSSIRKKPIKLPTNSQISVGEFLEGRENIIFVGTASNPDFNFSKLDQLPDLSRQALERVGTENAVAIGFRTQDAQAAARITTSGEIMQDSLMSPEYSEIEVHGDNKEWNISKDGNDDFDSIDDISQIIDLIMGIISYELVNAGVRISKATKLTLYILEEQDTFQIKVLGKGLSDELQQIFNRAFSDPRIQTYMTSILKRYRMRKKGLKLHLKTTSSGKLSFSSNASYLELV